MNWDAIGSVAEVFGAVGVIVSLLYLASQIRQNTREMRSSTSQNFLSSFNALSEFSQTSEYGADLWHRMTSGKMNDATEGEIAAYRFYLLKLHRLFEHAFLQHQAGLLADDVWHGWRAQIAMSMAIPGAKQGWNPVKLFLAEDYISFVESLEDESIKIASNYSAAWASAWEPARPEWAPDSQDHGSPPAK